MSIGLTIPESRAFAARLQQLVAGFDLKGYVGLLDGLQGDPQPVERSDG